MYVVSSMEMNDQAETLKRCSQRMAHVVLAWGDTTKKIVAPPAQFAVLWNHAFSSLIRSSSGLIDNFDFPKELFELLDLHEVLTMEIRMKISSSSALRIDACAQDDVHGPVHEGHLERMWE